MVHGFMDRLTHSLTRHLCISVVALGPPNHSFRSHDGCALAYFFLEMIAVVLLLVVIAMVVLVSQIVLMLMVLVERVRTAVGSKIGMS